MKVNSITTNTGYPRGRASEHSNLGYRASEKERHSLNNIVEYNNDQINTTIRNNSDGRVSFKGGPKAPIIHSIANFAFDNPLVAEAIFAIFITCGLRPLSIMATAKTKEDKEKCSYQAAKSISSGVVGLGTTALVGIPIGKAIKQVLEGNPEKNINPGFEIPEPIKNEAQEVVKKGVGLLKDLANNLKDNNKEFSNQILKLTEGDVINLDVFKNGQKGAEKIFKQQIRQISPEIYKPVNDAINQQRVLKNYQGAAKNVMEKLFQPGFMPLRATITIALVPIILGLFGKKKPSTNKPVETNKNPYNTDYNIFYTQDEKKLFQTFAGVNNNAN